MGDKTKVMSLRLSAGDYRRLHAYGVSKGLSWIGNTYLDDSGRDSPASLNSTGDM